MKQEKNETKNKLYRSKNDKVVAGVCGGIAEHFDVDPIWIRLAAILLVLADGVGLILYIAAWVLVPENPNHSSTKKSKVEEVLSKNKKNKPALLGAGLVALGILLLLKNVLHITHAILWPGIIILIGIYLVSRRKAK